MNHQKRVVIVAKYVPKYRVDFFNALRDTLTAAGVELVLVYGQPEYRDRIKQNAADLPWGIYKKSILLSFMGKTIYWQPVLKEAAKADLVIVEQASRLLVNYVLILLRPFLKNRIAFWGHGKNFQQSSVSCISETIKRFVSQKVDWWFAYTRLTAEILEQGGFPSDRISVVNNSINTRSLEAYQLTLTEQQLIEVRNTLSLQGSHIGLFVGGIYPEKKIDFLLDACELIREQVPDFEMIFVGSGVEVDKVIDFCQTHSWCGYVPPIFGKGKVPYFSLASVFLMPGLVGLAILDCFSLGVPLVTTAHANHSPEISYLENGINGLMVPNDQLPEFFAHAVVKLLLDDIEREILVDGCKASAKKYSLEAMVVNFSNGIQSALGLEAEK